MNHPQAFPTRAFRDALGAFATGVTVVTARGPAGEDVGLTANSFNSVSLDPPLVLWSLAKTARSRPAFEQASHFAVHVLAADQDALALRFAQRGADKFAGLELARGPGDLPLLSGCAARFICRTVHRYEGGDHLIFVGEVEHFEHWPRPPLLFHAGRFARLDPPAEAEQGAARPFLGELLRRAYRALYAPVKQVLASHDLSVGQYFLLSRIAHLDRPTARRLRAVLAAEGRAPQRGELADLLARGLVVEEGGRLFLSAAGQKLHLELAAAIEGVEADAERSLPWDLRQTLGRVLEQLAADAPTHS
ncbi:MAG: hypothetical protein KatS3mg124_1087 [Porticoccaceae bacterium]|nr:MAG: hypothetical protein KatS3mg124_1087 [Porticoccaceae bacterium]